MLQAIVVKNALKAVNMIPTSPTSSYTYYHDDSEWGDKLTAIGSNQITYDELGNPLTYYYGGAYTFRWTGRRLTGATYLGNTYTFTYDDNGMRTTKVKNGVTTTYYYDGSRLIAEDRNGSTLIYIYDASGAPAGMQYHDASYAADTWDVYWYEKNLQGDVVAVYDDAGVKLAVLRRERMRDAKNRSARIYDILS